MENLQNNDPWGIGMTITAMAVVFLSLVLLVFAFILIGRIAIRISKYRAKKACGHDTHEMIPGEVIAAIAGALYEVAEDTHDMENTVLTIHKVARAYSPWSSKIYGLREPRNK
jgi:Na+-transporting methylmalonyl-CoA/oxaloacetate decarboxylase gamma subunit